MNCLNCDTNIDSLPRSKGRKFCSRSCSCTYNNRLMPKRPPTGNCKACQTPIRVHSTWCEECKVNLAETRNDLRLRDWKLLYDLNQYHAKLRGHARSVFRLSGKPKSCAVCSYDLHVDICHLKEVKDFDLDSKVSEVNDICNLVALCKNHHWELDNGHLFL